MDPTPLIRSLLEAIRHRSLWQVLGAYAVICWSLLQVVDQLVQQGLLPGGVYRIALGLVLVGLLLVLTAVVVHGREMWGPQEGSVLSPLFTWWGLLIVGGGALTLWAAVSVVGWLAWGSGEGTTAPADADDTARTIAVLPFSFQGSSDFSYLGNGIVDLLGTRLDGAGDLRSVDARAVLAQFAEEPPPDLDPDRARVIAGGFGAHHFVLGSIVEIAGRLEITVKLYGEDGGEGPFSEAAVGGSAEELFDMVDEMAAHLLSGMYEEVGDRGRRIAGVTTGSLPAFKAYLEGEAAFRQGRFHAAVEAFQRSVSLDSLYALGFYRLSVAAEWDTQTRLSQWAAMRAADGADRLSDRDRDLLDAHLAWRRGAYEEAQSQYRSFVGRYPEDVEAWFQLGEALFHGNPMLGRSLIESRFAFERVASLEPDHAASLLHLMRIAARERDIREVDSLSAVLLGIRGSDREPEERAMWAYSSEGETRQREFLEWLQRRSDQAIVNAAVGAGFYAFDLTGLLEVAALLTEPSRAREVRVLGHRWRAFAFMARGEWEKAGRELDAVEPLDPGQALETRVLLALTPYSPVTLEELRDLRTKLVSMEPIDFPASGNPSFFFSVHDRIHRPIREFLLGRLSLALGEVPRALDHASALEAMETPLGVGTMARDLSRGIRAEALRLEGRAEEAYELLARDQPEIFYHYTTVSPFVSLVPVRFLRGELLRDLGRDAEALEWFENLVQLNPGELPLLPIALCRRAELLEGMGRSEAAAEVRSRLSVLWAGADEDLRERVGLAPESGPRPARGGLLLPTR